MNKIMTGMSQKTQKTTSKYINNKTTGEGMLYLTNQPRSIGKDHGTMPEPFAYTNSWEMRG